MQGGWQWDPTLYAGSAEFYACGRAPYPPELAERIATALGLRGTGRLLDCGCGPGSLTLLMAPHVAEVIGLDPDPDMLAVAAARARAAGLTNTFWRQMRAEDLPADLVALTAITFAQSFHWMDRARVAATARRMLAPDGAVVHVGATTNEGAAGTCPLPYPRPPRAEIATMIRRHLGTLSRAGQGVRPADRAPDEDAVLRSAGFSGPERFEVPARTLTRTAGEVRASVYSLSYAAPHLFGAGFDAFDGELRALLHEAAPDGLFSERMREITVDVWR